MVTLQHRDSNSTCAGIVSEYMLETLYILCILCTASCMYILYIMLRIATSRCNRLATLCCFDL